MSGEVVMLRNILTRRAALFSFRRFRFRGPERLQHDADRRDSAGSGAVGT